MRIDVGAMPQVPAKDSPKALFVNYNLEPLEVTNLYQKGWEAKDVRLLSCSNLKERQEIVLAWLEGLRQGTLEERPKLLDWLELEARVCGLATGKVVPTEKAKIDKKTVDQILDFTSSRAFRSVGAETLAKFVPKA